MTDYLIKEISWREEREEWMSDWAASVEPGLQRQRQEPLGWRRSMRVMTASRRPYHRHRTRISLLRFGNTNGRRNDNKLGLSSGFCRKKDSFWDFSSHVASYSFSSHPPLHRLNCKFTWETPSSLRTRFTPTSNLISCHSDHFASSCWCRHHALQCISTPKQVFLLVSNEWIVWRNFECLWVRETEESMN